MKKIIFILGCLLFIFCITGCENSDSKQGIQEEKTLEQILYENNYILLDVRSEEEFSKGHLVGALNIPHDVIRENLSFLDKSKVLLVYCRSGNRSKLAYNTLKGLGYQVYDLGAYDSIDLEKESFLT